MRTKTARAPYDILCASLGGRAPLVVNSFCVLMCVCVRSGLARAAAGGGDEAVGASARHQRRAPLHAVFLLAHTHGHTLPSV